MIGNARLLLINECRQLANFECLGSQLLEYFLPRGENDSEVGISKKLKILFLNNKTIVIPCYPLKLNDIYMQLV